MSTLINIIIASLLVSLISLVGSFFLLLKTSILEKVKIYMVSWAAGIMLAAAFVDLFPEALEAAGDAPEKIFIAALLGVVLFFFLERFVLWFHHHDEVHGAKPSTILVLVGDGIHNFIDGIAIAAAFMVNPGLGIATTLAMAAHEIPQEIADLSILHFGGMSKKKTILYNFVSGLTALLGAILGYFALSKINGLLPILLAFTAGMFIYLACSDLIPDLHHEFKKDRRWEHAIPFVLGIVILFCLIRVLEG